MKAICIMMAGCLAAAALWAAGATGRWTAEMQGRDGNTMTVRMTFKADGDDLTGAIEGPRGETEITEGIVDSDNIWFKVVRGFNGNEFIENYKGKVEGDTIHFWLNVSGGHPREFDAHRL